MAKRWIVLLAAATIVASCSKKPAAENETPPTAKESAQLDTALARLKSAALNFRYTRDTEYGPIDSWVADMRYDAGGRALILTATDEDLENEGVILEQSIPLAYVAATPGSGNDGSVSGVFIDCDHGVLCIAARFLNAATGLPDGNDPPRRVEAAAFGCAANKCQAIIDDLNSLAAMARADEEAANNFAASTISMAQLDALADAPLFRVSDGESGYTLKSAAAHEWKKKSVLLVIKDDMEVGFDGGSQRQLKIDFEIPLDKVSSSAGLSEYQIGDVDKQLSGVSNVLLNCDGGASCVTERLSGGAMPKKSANIPCLVEKCASLRAAYDALIAAAKGGAAAPRAHDAPEEETTTTGRAKPVSRAVAQSVSRVNARINREAPALPGFLPTQGVIATSDGRIRLHTDSCAASPKGCAPDAISDNEVAVEFAAADIAPGSIAINGSTVIFTCRPGDTCIRSPDGRLRLQGYGLPCGDATECNRLVIDFASLVDLAAAQ